jgi:hypothetical protein
MLANLGSHRTEQLEERTLSKQIQVAAVGMVGRTKLLAVLSVSLPTMFKPLNSPLVEFP